MAKLIDYFIGWVMELKGIDALLFVIIVFLSFYFGYHSRSNDMKMAFGVNADKVIESVLNTK